MYCIVVFEAAVLCLNLLRDFITSYEHEMQVERLEASVYYQKRISTYGRIIFH